MKALAKTLVIVSVTAFTALTAVQDASAWWGGNNNNNDNWGGNNDRYYGGPGYGRGYGGGGYPPQGYGGRGYGYPQQGGYPPPAGYGYAPAQQYAAPAAPAPAPAAAPQQRSYGSYGNQSYDSSYGAPPPSGAPNK